MFDATANSMSTSSMLDTTSMFKFRTSSMFDITTISMFNSATIQCSIPVLLRCLIAYQFNVRYHYDLDMFNSIPIQCWIPLLLRCLIPYQCSIRSLPVRCSMRLNTTNWFQMTRFLLKSCDYIYETNGPNMFAHLKLPIPRSIPGHEADSQS